MDGKKPISLTDSLSSGKKYLPSSLPGISQTSQQQGLDLNKLKTKLNSFQKKLLKKFPFIKVLGILPPQSYQFFEEDEALPKEIIESKPTHLIMLMPEEQYKNLNKIKQDVVALVKETGENLWVHIKTAEVDLWNYGLDSKYELIDAVSSSFPLYDDGFLGALRVANIHKSLVLNWLNVGRVRYVATYAIGGSLVRGTADETSDVDTFVIIDDTDVKRMSRVELLEKLRGKITYEFIKEATALAGVKNILNVQVYLLTDFWQSVKDAQPVMFTFIRDGIPLYDRGTFIPWKRLLQMGRIKPSPEAIDLYMKEGDRTESIIARRQLDNMVDVYFGVVTPTQAMMMLAGSPPPIPKTIVEDTKKLFVEKEKLLSLSDLKTLEKVVKMYKDYEHGKLKEIPGKEIDIIWKEAQEYIKKMKSLREKLEKRMQEHQANKIHSETISLMKTIFGKKSQQELLKDFESELVKKGKVQERMLSIAKELITLKSKVKTKKLSQSEMQRISRDASDLLECLTEYSQRKELVSLERNIAQLTAGSKKAELVSTKKGLFVVESAGAAIRKIEKAKLVKSDRKELEEAIKNSKEKMEFNLPSKSFAVLKKEFGEFELSF